MIKSNTVPKSFSVDHTSMSAPQVRKAEVSSGPCGDVISKFDLRLIKPNTDALPTAAVHTLEHLLATYMRECLSGVIDLSPMGCRTGFYLLLWGDVKPDVVRQALIDSLRRILSAKWEDVPGTSAESCGNYRDHSLFSAQEYARQILSELGEEQLG